LGLLGKPFPLLIVLDFTNFYLKIYNLLGNLLVSNIILMIAKLGMENAKKSKGLVPRNPDKAKLSVRRGRKAAGLWKEEGRVVEG
jgi:hypothetical protein